MSENPQFCGILPVNKSPNFTSFHLVHLLRKKTNIEKIGHAGTLDPFATGVMVMLIGRAYTRFSNQFLSADKAYHALIHLGETRDSFDIDGKVLSHSDHIPSLTDVENALKRFQGDCQQIPPMFSAKKIAGQKLYEIARKGGTIERAPISIRLATTLIRYEYPYIELDITCSKGTYIRALAHDLGEMLECGAFLEQLSRTRSGSFTLADCVSQDNLSDPTSAWTSFLRKTI